MLKLTFLEFIARGLPEALLYIFSSYKLTGTEFKIKNYLISALLMAIIVYVIRLLPIQLGVNTIMTIGVVIILNIKINKISTVKAIVVSVFIFTLASICELLNMLIIQYWFKADIAHVFSDPKLKTLYGLPSLVLFAALIILSNYILKKVLSKRQGTKLVA